MVETKKSSKTKKSNTTQKEEEKPKKVYKVKKEPYDKKRYAGAVKVREIKVIEKTEEDEFDEAEDRKLIAIIATSILVIVGTIIGLLVGEQEMYEPDNEEKKQEDTIVVDKDKIESEEDTNISDIVASNEEEVTTTSTKKYSSSKKISSKQETKYYNVYYYYGYYDDYEEIEVPKMHHVKQEEDSNIEKYNPIGYKNCKYYSDSNMMQEYDFNNTLDKDTNIYLDCNEEEYSVNYVFEQNLASDIDEGNIINPYSFTSNNTIVLNDLNTEYNFLGWYLNYDSDTNTYSNRIYALDRNLYKYIDSNNNLTIYGKVSMEVNVVYHNINDSTITKVVDDIYVYLFDGNIFDIDDFLGWTDVKGSKSIIHGYAGIEDEVINLYPVIGSAIIAYNTEVDGQLIGYTEEELNNYSLPTVEELDLMPAYYIVPVSEETNTSKKIVSDDDVEIDTNKQMTLSEASSLAEDGYTPLLGDNVEEIEKIYEGWKEIIDFEDYELHLSEETVSEEDIKEEIDESTEEIPTVELYANEVSNTQETVEG